jgi:hypothetical protein
MMLQSV